MIMGMLKKGTGKFDLSNSDCNVGSFFSIDDLLQILNINSSMKNHVINSLVKEGLLTPNSNLIDEMYLQGAYKYLIKAFSLDKFISNSSFDEYVLYAILKKCYPNAVCKRQVPVTITNPNTNRQSRIKVDFYIKWKNQELFIEFDGPNHFYKQSGYNNIIVDPFIRVNQVQNATGIRMVRWPYWVQRCERNVRVLLEPSTYKQGYGALWSTSVLFGDFDPAISNWADIIMRLNDQFHIANNNSIKYIYGDASGIAQFGRKQPQHPIINKCVQNNSLIATRLIPTGAKSSQYWF